jgi:hypothetical protein
MNSKNPEGICLNSVITLIAIKGRGKRLDFGRILVKKW